MEYKKGFWYDINDNEYIIKDMETSYIINCIKFLKKRPDFYDICGGSFFMDEEPYYEENNELVLDKIEEFEIELKRRGK